MTELQMSDLKRELIEAIKSETHNAIKHTGHTWVKDAVKDIVPVAVEETLTRLGIDCHNPFECQKDMAYLRSSRQANESIVLRLKTKSAEILLGACVAGLVAYLVVNTPK